MVQDLEYKDINQVSILIFQIGWEQFVVDLLEVKEIIQARQIRKLPKSLDYIDGIYNYRGDIIHVVTYKGTPVNFCMPSIDVLFFSAARVYRDQTMGVLLTGMGSDGVEGLGAIKTSGGNTIAESEETSILYAMPKFAAEKGFADLILSSYKIPRFLIDFANLK